MAQLPDSFAQPKPTARPATNKLLKNWTPFASKAGNFSALFPATPKSMVRTEGKYKVHAFFHAVPGGAYMVTYGDMREAGFSKSQIQAFNDQEILDSTRQGLLTGSRGKLVSERHLSWQGFPAREVVYDIPQLNVRSRSMLIFSRPFVYHVTVILPKKQGQTAPPTTRAFLDAFQIHAPHS